MLTERSVSAMATVLNPSAERAVSGSSIQLQGTRKTVPIETRTARRLSGSQLVGVSRTESTPRAAAERNMAPMLVVSVTPSITATREAVAHSSRQGRGPGRRSGPQAAERR